MAKQRSGKGKKQSQVSKNREDMIEKASRGNRKQPKSGKALDPDKYVDAKRPEHVEP